MGDANLGPSQAMGKQWLAPIGTMYSRVSGIWQTVWLEPVPADHIEGLKMIPDIDAGCLRLSVVGVGTNSGFCIEAVALEKGREVARVKGAAGSPLVLPIRNAKLWSPEQPFLYDLKVSVLGAPSGLFRRARVVDEVTGYFGMRKVSLIKDSKGMAHIALNNQTYFMVGTLDESYWPDGLYTAPTDAARRYDVEFAKSAGFNLLRKTMKVEPERWYYWCDKLGLLVLQDMPAGYPAAGWQPGEISRSPSDAAQFELELRRMVEGRINCPSIAVWVVFNETWGQFDTVRLTRLVEVLDPSRLVDSASGATDFGAGHIVDGHQYPGPFPGPSRATGDAKADEFQWGMSARATTNRASFLGEFGGVMLMVKDHFWGTEAGLGPFIDASYPMAKDSEDLTARYEKMLEGVGEVAKEYGISGAVYTGLTDVENECNGFITYDRAVIKVDLQRVAAANRKLAGH